MKKLFVVVSVVVLLAARCQHSGHSQEVAKSGNPAGSSPDEDISHKTYADNDYGFSFEYPAGASVTVQNYSDPSSFNVRDVVVKLNNQAVYVSIASPSSVETQKQFCKNNTEGLCITYIPLVCEQKGQSRCQEYGTAIEGDGSPQKKAYIEEPKTKNKIQINLLIPLDSSLLFSEHPVGAADFKDSNIEAWYRQGKVSLDSLAALEAFNQIYSSFEFTN